jgi:hypothetical protein
MDGLDCYGGSDDEEAEAQTTVKGLAQPEIKTVEIASLPATAACAADMEVQLYV